MTLKSYKVLSKNEEKESIGEVEIEVTNTTAEKTTMTMNRINQRVAAVDSKIALLNTEKTNLQAMLPGMDVEAKKVTLFKPKSEPVPEA